MKLSNSARHFDFPISAIAAALAHATLLVVPGAGHMLPLERPDRVTGAIADVCCHTGAARPPQRVPTDR